MLDSETPSAYGMKERKAKKDHTCYECRGVIKAGEKYAYHHGVWDGRGASFKVCCDCEKLRNELLELWGEDIAFGWLEDASFDADYEDRFDAIREARRESCKS